jgi:hypothetical protein
MRRQPRSDLPCHASESPPLHRIVRASYASRLRDWRLHRLKHPEITEGPDGSRGNPRTVQPFSLTGKPRTFTLVPGEVQDRFLRSQLAADDVLDAYALAITASHIHAGTAIRLPQAEAERDLSGLRMEIWY